MVPDRKEDNLGAPEEVEQQVLVQDEFSKLVSRAELAFDASERSARLQRPDRVSQKGAARSRELAERGNQLVEQAIQESIEGRLSFAAEKGPDGVQILGEVLAEEGREPSTGHSGREAYAPSRCGRP